MNLKNHIEWNEWLIQYLLQQGIEMFDWKAAHEAEKERISKMTLEEQEEELSREARELEAMYDDDYEDFSDFEEEDFEEEGFEDDDKH
ncbi:MAG: hypothetical protein AB7D46_04910 [Flavobacteriaceae bacterium]